MSTPHEGAPFGDENDDEIVETPAVEEISEPAGHDDESGGEDVPQEAPTPQPAERVNPAQEPASAPRGFGVSLFAIAVIVALLGSPIIGLLLSFFGGAGAADFSALDPQRIAPIATMAIAFVAQFAFLVSMLMRAGATFWRTAAAVSAIVAMTGITLMVFVNLQCQLYGDCL